MSSLNTLKSNAYKKKYELLTLDEIEQLSMSDGIKLFRDHINPGVAKMYKMLGLARRKPIKAENMSIFLDDGSEVLDLAAGITVVNCGHNHPRIMAARKKWAESLQLEHWKFIPSPHQGALAYNLSQVFPGDLNYVFYCNSGAEANEGALKMAQMYAGKKRKKIVYTDISFHGKTLATLSVSGSERNNNTNFNTLPNCLEIPYGDADALENIIRQYKKTLGESEVGTFIVEAIRSEGVVVPADGYLKRVRKICDKYDVVLILDEVFCGFGRTGKMFAFEHENIVPDICSFSKAFGAGKASFGGFIARSPIFKGAYGSLKNATIHSTTYNGFGEEIVTAIETLHIIQDEKLVENSSEVGDYFLERLQEIKKNHPLIVKDVRGVGLLLNIELESISAKISKALTIATPEEVVAKVTTGGIINELYEKHNILVYAPLHHNNLIMITPPLTITKKHVDQFITALDSVLKTNIVEKGMVFIKNAMTN